MKQSTVARLEGMIKDVERRAPGVKFATVTNDAGDPLAVDFGGAEEPVVGLEALGGTELKKGDSVLVLARAPKMFVLGGIGDGLGGGGGGPFQPKDDQLSILAGMSDLVATALAEPSVEGVLGNLGGALATDLSSQLIGRIEFYGHSGLDTGTYDTSHLSAMSSRLSAMLKADCADYSIPGAQVGAAEMGDETVDEPTATGDGGWGTVFRNTENEGADGPYEPRRDVAVAFYGVNDLGWFGPTAYEEGEATMNALEAVVSRLRAATIFEEDSAQWTFTGTWTTPAQSGAPNKYDCSGGAVKRTTSGSAEAEFEVPADAYSGATVAICFRTGPSGEGALWDIQVNGTSVGSHDTRDKQPQIYGAGSPPSQDSAGVSVFRVSGLEPGDVILCDITTLGTNATIDCAWIEAEFPPLVILPKFWNLVDMTDFSWMPTAGYPYEPDANDWEAMREAQEAIASKFPSRVITIDLDGAIGGNAAYFADVAHLNEDGHARCAEQLYRGLMSAARGIAAHARGNVKGSGLRTTPHDAEANRVMNLIQPAYPRRPGLQLRQSKRATTPMIFSGFVDTVAPLLGVENRDSTQTAWIGSYGGTNRHQGASSLGFFTEGFAFSDGVLADFADADDANPRFSILGLGTLAWGPGGATVVDTLLSRSAAGEMTLDAPGASVADLVVTGDVTAGSINAPLGASSFTVNNPGGAGSGIAYRINQAGALDGIIADFALSTDANPRFAVLGTGFISWGAGGSSPIDVQLYRAAANVLKTNDLMQAALGFEVTGSPAVGFLQDLGGATQIGVKIANSGAFGQAFAYFGSAGDANARFAIAGTDPRIFFGAGGGTALDVNLYRSAADVLKTDDSFTVGTNLTVTGTTALNDTVTMADAKNIVLNTGTGTKIGTGTTQKLGFFNATPVAQQTSTTDLRTGLINLGFFASGGASPLNLNGGALTTTGVSTLGDSAATAAQVIVKGGASGTPLITLDRTTGATVKFSWSLAGGGLAFYDDIAGFYPTNIFADGGVNQLYIGQKSSATNISTRVSLLSASTHATGVGSNINAPNLKLQGGLGTGTGTPGDVEIWAGDKQASGATVQTSVAKFAVTYLGSVVVGSLSALSTSATDGFLYIPTSAGIPSGTPTAKTGKVAMEYDTTNNKLYVYNGGWKSVTLA